MRRLFNLGHVPTRIDSCGKLKETANCIVVFDRVELTVLSTAISSNRRCCKVKAFRKYG